MYKIAELDLFRLLKSRELEDGFRPGEISEHVHAVLSECQPVLNQVSRNFPEYTLHDPDHGARVVQSMKRITPGATLGALNSIELSILLYAGYLHDIGMASPQSEFESWLADAGQDFIQATERWNDLMSRSAADPIARRRVEDMAYTDYLRSIHAERSASYIKNRFGPEGLSTNRITVREVNYAHLVAQVAQSHCRDAFDLRAPSYRRDELVRDLAVNVQYLCVLLRLCDLVDLDPERTPKVLLDFIDPTDPRSAAEWSKHRSVQGWEITENRIRFRARCSHPAIQMGLREWMTQIEQERLTCMEIVRDNRGEIGDKYQLLLHEPVPVDPIESDGSYIFGEFRFEIDYERIVDLLMGTQLWGTQNMAYRELVQNAIDTCRHRAAVSERYGLPYAAEIALTQSEDELTCEDNGMGMNPRLIEEYFMRIGRSYYQSFEFMQQELNFKPISQFGLGIMSSFMLGDRITVETRALDMGLGGMSEPIRLEVDGPNKYFVVRPGGRQGPGTRVRIALRPASGGGRRRSAALGATIRALVRHPIFPIRLTDGKREEVLSDVGFAWTSDSELWIANRVRVQRADVMFANVERFEFMLDSKATGGMAGRVSLFLLKDDEGRLVPKRREGATSFEYGYRGEIEYRVWRIASGAPAGQTQGASEIGVIGTNPAGHRWSQDGIVVQGPMPRNDFPIPFMLDVDLQGSWKLPLTVDRTRFAGEKATIDDWSDRLMIQLASLLKDALASRGMTPNESTGRLLLEALFDRSPRHVRDILGREFGYPPTKRRYFYDQIFGYASRD